MKKILLLLVIILITITGCNNSNEDTPADPFELAGTSWFLDDVTVGPGAIADITVTFNQNSYSNTTVMNAPASGSYPSSGPIVSYNNTENYYIARIEVSSADPGMVGKYGRTIYNIAADGLTGTITSYSYEDTAAAALASTTIVLNNISMVKQ